MAVKERAVRNLKRRRKRVRSKNMSEGFERSYDTREMTLREEIENLKACNVPEPVRERMLRKLDEIEAWYRERSDEKLREVHRAEEKEINRLAVIDALGDYINRKNSSRYH